MARRNFNNSNPVEKQSLTVTVAEAIKLVKASRNRTIRFHAQVNAPTASEPTTHYFNLHASFPVNAATAVTILTDMYRGRFETEALVRIHVTQHLLFIG